VHFPAVLSIGYKSSSLPCMHVVLWQYQVEKVRVQLIVSDASNPTEGSAFTASTVFHSEWA
jgi:hypothetical protein